MRLLLSYDSHDCRHISTIGTNEPHPPASENDGQINPLPPFGPYANAVGFVIVDCWVFLRNWTSW